MNWRNQTDYEFPDSWGLYTDRQKHEWFVRERTFRRAIAQDTVFGRAYRQAEAEQERLDTDRYRYDTDGSDSDTDGGPRP